MKMHKWRDIRSAGGKISAERLAELDRQVAEESAQLELADLRNALGVTQVDLAKAIETSQEAVSRIESREDHKISTMRRYVEALGGKLEVTAIVKGRRVPLSA
jgi:DNA-binding XRE family transcriptional regulator